MKKIVKFWINCFFRRKGVISYIRSIKPKGIALDVGCGNASAERYKSYRPDIFYIGLDVGDYNQNDKSFEKMDEYTISDPVLFSDNIKKYAGKIDAVISSHNIEHCLFPNDVLVAMAMSLKPEGKLYLSFPCAESVSFPSRKGTLNFFDDETHRETPNFDEICDILKSSGLDIIFSKRRYRPALFFLVGLLLEPFCSIFKIQAPYNSTWALYGFESVIWAVKTK